MNRVIYMEGGHIEREWTAEEFGGLSEAETRAPAHDPELLEQFCDYELCIRKGRAAYFRTLIKKE